MRVFFRVDASSQIGTGHLVRCLTLADRLHSQGAEITFICRAHADDHCDLIKDSRFRLDRLPQPNGLARKSSDVRYASWLGVGWQEDARETQTAIENTGCDADWLVVDHYGIDGRWESFLRDTVERILVIDDIADREHDCDLLVDQNLVSEMHTRYEGKTPDGSRRLLGPKYALLQEEYRQHHSTVAARSGKVTRIPRLFWWSRYAQFARPNACCCRPR